jgi:hypothetical protein
VQFGVFGWYDVYGQWGGLGFDQSGVYSDKCDKCGVDKNEKGPGYD